MLPVVKSVSASYILALVDLPHLGCYAASTSSPENVVLVLDNRTLAVRSKLQHPDRITQIKANGAHLVSACRDGLLRIWDCEKVLCINTFSASPRAILCFDISPDCLLMAAGTELQGDDAIIYYWDPHSTNSPPIRMHTSTHSDDITCLAFLPSSSGDASKPRLLSTSTDGLLCISDPQTDDEDEAVIVVANWGCSIAQAGVITSSADSSIRIWAASDMETFSVWSNEELDLMYQLSIKDTPPPESGIETDYLICVPPHLNTPSVFVGSNSGEIIQLSLPNSQDSPPKQLSVVRKYTSNPPSHTSIVRTILIPSSSDEPRVLVGGCEGGRISLWERDNIPEDLNHTSQETGMDVDYPISTGGKKRRGAADEMPSLPGDEAQEHSNAIPDAWKERKKAKRARID